MALLPCSGPATRRMQVQVGLEKFVQCLRVSTVCGALLLRLSCWVIVSRRGVWLALLCQHL